MSKTHYRSICSLGILWLLSCTHYLEYIPDPEKDVGMWVENFRQQCSFHFTYALRTTAIETSAQGECVLGRGAHIKGEWLSSDGKIPFEYIGLGHLEYSRQNNDWEKSSRGEQSDILTQITRLLEFDKFEYVGLGDGYYYRFKANIPFLAPHRWKEMVGTMKISAGSYLPEFIWAGLPDSAVFWEIRMFKFNKQKKISAPVKVWNEYILHASVDQRKKIERRLKLIDVAYQIKTQTDDLLLRMPEHYTIDDIIAMLGKSTWLVHAVAAKDSAARVAHLQGDLKKPVYLGDTLLEVQDIKDMKIKYDGAHRPYLEIKLQHGCSLSPSIAFEVNDVVCDITTLDRAEKISKLHMYTTMSFFDMQILRASLLQPLPVFDVEAFTGERG